MRLLLVLQRYWPSLGGAEVMLRRLAHAWVQSGHAVTVLTSQHEHCLPLQETDAGVDICRLPITRWRWVGTLRFMSDLRRWIERRRHDFDLAYGSMLKHPAYVLTSVGRRRALPVVLRAEGAGASGDVAWQQGALFGRRIQRQCQQADRIVAPSRVIQDELRAAGYAESQICFIPNGVPLMEPAWSQQQTAHHRRQLGLPERTTVVSTGRLHRDKGLLDLLAMLPMLDHDPLTQGCQLVLVGSGPLLEELVGRAADLGLKDRLILPGSVAEVTPWLRAADLFVLPSYAEGLSLSLLEALMLGLPSIASDIPANRNLLAADLLPLAPIHDAARLAQTIQQRLRQQQAQPMLIDQVRTETIRKYSLAAVAEKHLDLFHALSRQ